MSFFKDFARKSQKKFSIPFLKMGKTQFLIFFFQKEQSKFSLTHPFKEDLIFSRTTTPPNPISTSNYPTKNYFFNNQR